MPITTSPRIYLETSLPMTPDNPPRRVPLAVVQAALKPYISDMGRTYAAMREGAKVASQSALYELQARYLTR